MSYRYKVEFYIYAADTAEFNRKYERMRQVAEELEKRGIET